MKKLFITLGVLFSLFVLFIWQRADQGQLPAFITVLYNFPHGDKVGHFMLMGLLTFVVCLPFCRGEWGRTKKRILIVMSIVVVIITLEEISQHFFSSRSMDVVDLLCSYAGILCFGGLLLRICQTRFKKLGSNVQSGPN